MPTKLHRNHKRMWSQLMYRRLQDTGQSVSVILTFCTDESVPILLEPISRVLQDPKYHNTFGRTEGLIWMYKQSRGLVEGFAST